MSQGEGVALLLVFLGFALLPLALWLGRKELPALIEDLTALVRILLARPRRALEQRLERAARARWERRQVRRAKETTA